MTQKIEITYENLSQEEFMNGTCARIAEDQVNFERIKVDKTINGTVRCEMWGHESRATYALIVMDIATQTPKRIERIFIVKEQKTINGRVIGIICVAIVFLFA